MKPYLICFGAYCLFWIVANFIVFPFLINTPKRNARNRAKLVKEIVEALDSRFL